MSHDDPPPAVSGLPVQDLQDLQALVQAATLAPSSHNTQPWLFRLRPDGVDLLADRTRALPVNDPHDRELVISCGCALFSLRVAAAAEGLDADVALCPDTADGDVLARVRLAPAALPLQLDPLAALRAALSQRRTYRHRFANAVVDPEAVLKLHDAVRHEGAELQLLVTAQQRARAAELVAQGDALQWADPHWRRELAAWMHPRRRADGIVLPSLALPLAQQVVRSFDMGHGVGARDRELVDESPVLAVMSTEGDEPPDWLAAGQSLQRLLLVAVHRGLQASYLNQPVEVAALRPALQQLTGRPGHAQLLLRLGVPRQAVPAAPRRPVAEVLVDD